MNRPNVLSGVPFDVTRCFTTGCENCIKVKWFIHPLLVLIANATESELAKYVEYLKVESQVLRDRLPKKIDTTEAERTMQVQRPSDQQPKTLNGGNRKPDEIHELVLAIRKETGWGGGRIKGELYRLGYRTIGRTTINNILRKHGFKPEPLGDPDNTWASFLRRYASTLWACDFFTKPVLTMHGWVDYYVLFFIHLETRKVHILGMTPNPDGEWMKQQARNLCIFFGEIDTPPKYIIHDADTKFTWDFRKILKSEGIKPVRIGPRRPNQNAIAERCVGTIKRECLDRFLVFGEDHLRYLTVRFVDYYHTKRTHRGLDYHTPRQVDTSTKTATIPLLSRGDLVRRESLGGALKWYERKAG